MFSNPISFRMISLLPWTNLGSKSKEKEPFANVDHTLDMSTSLKRTNADLLKSVFDSD
jgi:hypothetical protein